MTDPSPLRPTKPKKVWCPECKGGCISYMDERGNSDHMNAHLCTKCSGTGKVNR